MNASKEISIHDNTLVSYEVLCNRREIRLHTEFRDRGEPYEFTDIMFTGVVAYDFRYDSEIGTIIFEITDVPASDIYEQQVDQFQAGIRYGWPGEWAKSSQDAADYFAKNSVCGYILSSSCGMNGWILARSKEIRPTTNRNDWSENLS
ncbi:hypothetical protein [Bythopirellula goksoeyrii]|uniref:Uncharacterized protein n=1 Tax=Bythopirellula goksoeyrii TaxID=1400387 RepID=A0A5B9QT12_9BACT|nr:hypothetical protein [Bythopirellula goksoeyrii]QEG37063.1 hypothetical protein Pr1d_44030 [Bythopirellula goksoeyrii]